MRELVFCLEGEAEKAMLEGLLPRLSLPEDFVFRYLVFQGKQDLAKQLPLKLRKYINPQARFFVLRDQDSHPNCVELKASLVALCTAAGRPFAMVRIACREMESFFLADLLAVERGLDVKGLSRLQRTEKFRAPDRLGSPAKELVNLTRKQYQKVSGSRLIGRHLQLDNERSPSFRNLVSGIRRLAA